MHILALQGTNLAHTPCEIIRKREFHLSFWEVTSNDGNQRANNNNNITACQAWERGREGEREKKEKKEVVRRGGELLFYEIANTIKLTRSLCL